MGGRKDQKTSSFRNAFRFVADVYNRFDGDRGFLMAAGISFYLILCFIPLILVVLSLAGSYLFGDEIILAQIREYMQSAIPALDPVIQDNIWKIIENRQILGLMGILGLLWTSTLLFGSLRSALNIIFRVKKERSVLRGKLADLLMIVLGIVLLLGSMILTSIITLIEQFSSWIPFNLDPFFQLLLGYIVPFFFTLSVFFMIYKVAPNRKVPFRLALNTALVTAILWEVAKNIFEWYVLHLANYSAVYGSLAALAVFFFWIYYSAVVLVIGGEVAALLEERKKKA